MGGGCLSRKTEKGGGWGGKSAAAATDATLEPIATILFVRFRMVSACWIQ